MSNKLSNHIDNNMNSINDDIIEKVVRHFYNQIGNDPLLGPIFNKHINDWEPHLQKMFTFWSSVMLQSRKFKGSPMQKHVILPVDRVHFDRWLQIFKQTVEDICTPSDAALFMVKAKQIAQSLEMGIATKHNVFLKTGERFNNKNIRTSNGS